ncbi:MAG: hypothetical protein JST38_14520 [Bacteroidetes bacterium]|nr:hypothetical protein [Bacteroidota bacterium]
MRYLNRNTMTRALAITGLFLLFATACKKDGSIPSYLEVDQPVVVGSNGQIISSKITDLWVYVNDQPAGVWEPGKQVPLIASGPTTVKLIAGVRKNGIADDRIQYPFYETWQQQVNLVPEQTLAVQPQFHYYNNLTYWLSDFDTGLRFDTVDCTATMTIVPSDSTLVGQGTGNGRISLDGSHPLYRGLSSGDPFTGIGSTAFLEMDYRCDAPFQIGVRVTTQGNPSWATVVYLKATKLPDGSMPWNKVYIDLATPWNVPGAMDKRFFIQASLPDGAATATVDLDNIKLVQP